MIINALCDYYHILVNEPESEIAKFGFSTEKVSAVLVLSEEGELLEIISLINKEAKEKLTEPRLINVPIQKGRSGKNPPPYFMCDNMKYVLGFDKNKNSCTKQFEAFKEYHLKLLADAQGYRTKAFRQFLNKWDCVKALENEIIASNLTTLLADRNLIFRICGESQWLHEDSEIMTIWENELINGKNEYYAQCMITGEHTAISKLHKSLKNVRDAQSSGASLVSFNDNAYVSYNKSQSYNAPVGETSEFAYTTVLNKLLSSRNQKIQIGDATTVFWAASTDDIYSQTIMEFFAPTENVEDNSLKEDLKTQRLVRDILDKARKGIKLNDIGADINQNTKFYILGLSPNAARISVRFFYCDTFGAIVEKLSLHYRDMELVKQFEKEFTHIPLWKLISETVSPKSSDKKPSPLLAGGLMRAMLSGGLYPQLLYNSIMLRIKADNEIRVNYVRASIIKLCLMRRAEILNNKKLKEVLSVALNEETKNIGYLLGRLFAVYEKLQLDSSGGVNSSVRDKYFTSACTTPKSVFPILIRLSQHHISKAKYGFVTDKLIERIMADIDHFPANLDSEEQGLFALGYYQQRVKLWEKQVEQSNKTLSGSERK